MATQISIHAPAKGATRGTCAKDTFSANFNPRSREGSDKAGRRTDYVIPISIHAPAKGATSLAIWIKSVVKFQSTLPRRERLFRSYGMTGLRIISIHAPAKGATQVLRSLPLPFLYFNPRSREGSDHSYSSWMETQLISIHAPAKGATTTWRKHQKR